MNLSLLELAGVEETLKDHLSQNQVRDTFLDLAALQAHLHCRTSPAFPEGDV